MFGGVNLPDFTFGNIGSQERFVLRLAAFDQEAKKLETLVQFRKFVGLFLCPVVDGEKKVPVIQVFLRFWVKRRSHAKNLRQNGTDTEALWVNRRLRGTDTPVFRVVG